MAHSSLGSDVVVIILHSLVEQMVLSSWFIIFKIIYYVPFHASFKLLSKVVTQRSLKNRNKTMTGAKASALKNTYQTQIGNALKRKEK